MPHMRRTTQLSLIAAIILLGIVIGRAGFTLSWWLVAGAAGLALALVRTRLAFGGLMVLALALGLARTTTWQHDRSQLAELIGQSVTLVGVVADDPSVGESRQVTFKLGGLEEIDPSTRARLRALPESVTIYSYPVLLQRGHRVQAEGKLKAGFGTAVASLSYPRLTALSSQQDALEQFRQRFFAGMRTALPEPGASFGLGLLVGIRALIPKDMQAELALVGLSHLVAVSGYNLTIIVAAVDRLLGRFGRGLALVSSLWLIAGFLVVTGAGASIVRASLVSVLSLLASFYGRRFNPLTLILITAAATAAWNPVYLTDLGWLLSYLAFFGILVLAPALEVRLGHPKLLIVRLLIESTAAQILTLPLIMYFFGQLSLVSPITNLIILPLVPLAMTTSFLAGLGGMLIPAFSGWLAWPAQLLLSFMIRLIDAFAALPWAGTSDHLSLSAMIICYVVILALTMLLVRTNRRAGRPTASPRRRFMEVAAV
jgi:competence protein ComEC